MLDGVEPRLRLAADFRRRSRRRRPGSLSTTVERVPAASNLTSAVDGAAGLMTSNQQTTTVEWTSLPTSNPKSAIVDVPTLSWP